MDPNTRLRRHAQLWEAGTASVRQTAVAVLIFAAVMLFNIIPTYVDNEQSSPDELERVKKQLVSLAQEEKDIVDEQARTAEFYEKLGAISETLARAPWEIHIVNLRERFKSNLVTDHKKEADDTIHAVASQIRKDVVAPFQSAAQAYGTNSEQGDFSADAKKIEKIVDDWEKSTLPTDWYYTPESKAATGKRVRDELETEHKAAFGDVGVALQGISAKLEETQEEQARQIKKIADDKNRKLAEKRKIDEALQAALPGWAQKLVNVDSMVKFYPWILMAATVYLLGRGVNSASHFNRMADEEGWSYDERSDPLLSSMLTLTRRRGIGTAATLAIYSTVLIGLWYCVRESLALTDPCESCTTVMSNIATGRISNTITAIAVITVLATPFVSSRNQPAGNPNH